MNGDVAYIAAVAGIGSALGGLVGTLATMWVARKQIQATVTTAQQQIDTAVTLAEKDLHARVILAERMKWIATLRDSLAEFMGSVPLGLVLSQSTSPGSTERLHALLKSQAVVATNIILLLNPDEVDHIELHREVTAAALTQFGDHTTNAASAGDHIVNITEIARKILKREWERVKVGQ